MVQKRWMHIIPVAFIMYTIAFIDRTNISLAIPSMRQDLHMDAAQAGSAAGIFFWGYIVLQIPGGYLASRWSAKSFVSILLVAWGLCSVATGFVHTWREFWWMRLCLGVAEGGVWPAVLVLLAHWFPRPERARANAYWMLCLPIAVIVSSPLSGWILGHWNWRVLLIAEGALPFVWLVIWLSQIHDHPRQAGWISAEERDYLETTLGQEASQHSAVSKAPFLRTLLHPQVVVLVGIYFLINCGNYGYLFWLPSALQAAQKMSNLLVGVLQAIPYVLTAVGMVVVSRRSDRRRERRGHVAGALAWGGLFLLASVALSSHAPLVSFVCICLVGAGSYGGHGPFWCIPTETLPPEVAGAAMGLINALGNLGGYFGPLMVGYLDKRTGNFVVGFTALSLGLLVGSGLSFALRRAPAEQGDPRQH